MGGFFLLFDVFCMDISLDKFILGISPVTRTAGIFHGKRVISHGKSVPCNRTYYMAESVFALRLINLQPITYCRDQNFRSKCSCILSLYILISRKMV